ncbi:alpha/beta hydrolase protein [Rhizophagus clarus]|uniref:Alpha/beta hydrolase protein n=1 Tax=Rhizophagus clarus TaxID=94130 RepID=A0A8H3KX68_9GLOM|nr:alpha/beta hydrolase protein [Rhizophagus clarus]
MKEMKEMEEIDDKEFYLYYLNDLSFIPRPSNWIEVIMDKKIFSLFKTTLEYIRFIHVMAGHITLSFLTDFTLPLSQPFNFMFMITSFLIISLLLFPANIIIEICRLFNLFNFEFYDEAKWNRMTARKGLDKIKNIVQRGRKVLSSDFHGSQIFNLDMVETLLILSTIIYDQNVDKMHQVFRNLKIHEGNDFNELIDDCRVAYEDIDKKAKKLKMKFLPLSELGIPDSLFSGMYLSEHNDDLENNFIVVTFKGTSPTNFVEWLTDFLFMRVDASQFLFGEIHKGFYENFFPKTLDKTKESYPAKRMVESICNLAKKMHERNKKKVNVWITGHSLGAALAQVFYARLMKIDPLPDYCVLRDAYVFAGPAVGDKDFASTFNGIFNKNFKENRMLWRIVNTNDIVTKMPPQHLYGVVLRKKNDDEEEKDDNLGSMEDMLSKKLIDDRKDYEDSRFTLNNILNSILGKHNIASYYDYDINHSPNELIMDKIETFIPGIIHNHFPHRYFMAMERLRSNEYELVVGEYKNIIDKLLADAHVVF